MLLSYVELCRLIENGVLERSSLEHVNSASIDLVLGNTIKVEKPDYCVIDMLDKSDDHFDTIVMGEEGYIVGPGKCVLAHTVEIFHLPNIISGEYMLKSTQARNFMGHLKAGWADAGFNGSVLTLEFVNHRQNAGIRIRPGQKCGQIVFFQHTEVPADRSYAARGQYNGDKSVTAGKGLR